MAGYAGIATAISMAAEYQKEMTPHAHGPVAVSDVYFHNTLPQITSILEENIRDTRHDVVDRIFRKLSMMYSDHHISM